MRRSQVVLIVVVSITAMVARAAMSWGPANLIILAAFVLIAAAGLACVPSIPHRPFWAGFAGFGLFYALILAPPWILPGDREFFVISPIDPWFGDLAASHYGPGPSLPPDFTRMEVIARQRDLIDSFVMACHWVTGLGIGVLGGGLSLYLAKVRESQRWNREAQLDLPLEDFLPPLKVDPPLNPK